MDLVPVEANPLPVSDPEPLPGELKSREIGDSFYSLFEHKCPHCGRNHYRLLRFAGAFFSAYRLSEDFEPGDFDAAVEYIHEAMLFHARTVLDDARAEITAHTNPGGIANDGSYFAQMLDFVRLRMELLEELKALATIETSEPKDDTQRAIVAAFELGFGLSDLRIRDFYEDAIFEGFRMQQGRQVGRESAAKSKADDTRRKRAAIRRALPSVYARDPELARNDAATARAIEAMRLEPLCKDGRSIGYEAIVKHLRAIRQTTPRETA